MNPDAVPPPPPSAGPPPVFAHPLAWIVLAISLLASAGGWFIARNHEELAARKRFEEEAARIQMMLSERMSVYQDVLHGGAGLFAASYSVERSEWKAYVDAVSINERFPGIDGLGFIADVPRAKLPEFLKTTRADHAPDFQVRNPGSGNDLFIVKYLEPEAGHRELLGTDLGAEPDRRRVAEMARDTGRPAISSCVDLTVTNHGAQTGLVMLLPIFRNGAPTATREERRAGIVGWVYARFVCQQLMREIFRDQPPLVHLRVFDCTSPADRALVYDSDPATNGLPANYHSQFSLVDPMTIGLRQWQLQFTTKPAFDATVTHGSQTMMAISGGVISLLLFGIALSLSTTRARAQAMARDMTAAFRKANASLEEEIRVRQRSERRAVIQHAVTRVLAEAETLDAVAPKIIEAVCQSLGWDLGALWQIDPAAKQLRCVEIWHRPGLELAEFITASRRKTFRPGEGLPGRVWATTQPAWIADVARDRNFPRGPVAVQCKLHAAFGFPILLSDEFHGMIEFFSHEILQPDGDVLTLVAALGSQIGQFIERKRAQRQLQHEQFLLNTLMENLPDRIYFKDRHSRFMRNSRAHLQRFGLERASDAIGRTDFDFFTEEHARQAYEDEQELIRSGGQITKEEKETWPDGSVSWALSTKMVLRDENGIVVGTFGISRDITDRKRAEEAMRQARDAAQEANRAKSQFLANMSHELRTPLNSVIGFAGILLKNKPGNLNPNDLNFLERIQANGKHLLALINEVLDLSKIEARKVELQLAPVALDVLVRETIVQQEGLVRERPVKLIADVPAAVEPVKADADKLRQVIINLIGNALKFTERGSVTVRVVTDPASHRPVRIDVTDTGIGIPREKLAVIFEAFQQADASTARKYGGTGLGLTISQALCQLMGFHIEVASELDQGSTFSIILTGREKAAPPSKPDGSPPRVSGKIAVSSAPVAADLSGRLVLVIDDESDSRLLLTNLLEEFGCQVIAANSGEQGLRMAREFRPHLITVDLLMPQMDGASVIRALKADPELSGIPLVVVSIVAEERRGSILGAVDILVKPVVREDLLAALQRNLLQGRANILIVDDAEDARQILLNQLVGEPVETRTAANGREALGVMQTFTPDLILLDLIMPEMGGMEFLAAIRADERYQKLPVVIVTSKELTGEERELCRQQRLEIINKTDLAGDTFKQLLQRILKLAEKDGHPAPPK
jgi:PAS domain S-box-containing protein